MGGKNCAAEYHALLFVSKFIHANASLFCHSNLKDVIDDILT